MYGGTSGGGGGGGGKDMMEVRTFLIIMGQTAGQIIGGLHFCIKRQIHSNELTRPRVAKQCPISNFYHIECEAMLHPETNARVL